MGEIKQGVLGGFSGKVGTVVGFIKKGKSFMRALAANVYNPRTEGQVNQRNKFAAVVSFVSNNLTFINQGFRFLAKGMSAANAAHSYNIKNAITGTAPDFSVDYPNALVSRGKLEGVLNGTVGEASGTLTANWTDNSVYGNARPDDKVMLLVYNPARGESISLLEDPATRTDGSIATTLPGHYSGDTLHAYLAFQAANGSMVSDSSYLGTVTMA